MSKKNRNKPGKKPKSGGKFFQFANLTADRQLNTLVNKARTLYQDDETEDALELLEELDQKYPDRVQVLDILSACYQKLGYLEEACQLAIRLLKLTPPSRLPLVRYNLEQAYLKLGFPVLAYQQSRLFECGILADLTGNLQTISQCARLKKTIEEQNQLNAQENNLSFARYLEIGLPFEEGRWANQQGDYPTAQIKFKEVIQLEPTNSHAHNNLAMTYYLQGETTQALEECHFVLEQLDPANIHALANLIRINLGQGQAQTARKLLPRLQKLAPKADGAGLVKIAESLALLEADQAVFDLLIPLLASVEKIQQLDRPTLSQAVRLGVIAAANLGRYSQALELTNQYELPEPDLLLLRTISALENNESGPRRNERFYYFDPKTQQPGVYAEFQETVNDLVAGSPAPTPGKLSTKEKTGKKVAPPPWQTKRPTNIPARFSRETEENGKIEAGLEPFYQKHQEFVLEILGYSIWASLDFELMAMMLQLAVEGGIPGGVELVKRLAFTRAGDDFQHLAAVQALIDAGEIKPEEKVTIWLDRRTQRGTLAELTSIFQQMLTATFTEESEDYSQIGPLMNEALELTRRGQIEDSLKLYREIIRLKPDFPQAYFNLGALLASKLELSQAKPLIEQALHLNPDYTLAKITLAGIKARQDKLDEAAQDFLALEKEKGKFSPNELKVYYSGRLQLADWQQNYQAGLAASREWLELEPENAWLTRLIEKYKWQLEIGGYGNRLEKMKEEYRRKRWKEWGRIISSEVTLGEVLEGYNKAEMVAILKSWGKTEVNMSSKKETLKQAVWQLLSPQGLANEEKGLDGESREAFQSLLAMGGDAPYKEWQKKAGFTDGLRVDSPYLEYNQPDKLPGKLVAAGLVVIGGVEGALRAVVPHELRELKLLEPHFG